MYFIFIFGTLSTPCHLKLPTLIFTLHSIEHQENLVLVELLNRCSSVQLEHMFKVVQIEHLVFVCVLYIYFRERSRVWPWKISVNFMLKVTLCSYKVDDSAIELLDPKKLKKLKQNTML